MSVAIRSASVAFDFFIGNLVNGMTAIAQPARSALAIAFLLRSNLNCPVSEHPYLTSMF
jgi:hypothetical protein